MMKNHDIYISDIAYVLGDAVSIKDINSDSRKDEREVLLRTGLEKFCKSLKSNEELAYDAAAGTLNRTGINPGEIEVFIFSTTVLSLETLLDIKKIDRVLYDFGLKNAYPQGYFLSGCANIVGAIKVAAGLIKSGEHQTILVVVSDKLQKDEDRFMGSNESILSDGAVSFILSTRPGGHKLLHITQKTDPSYVAEEYNIVGYLKRSAEMVKKNFLQLAKLDNCAVSDYKKVFLGNYNLMVQRLYHKELGLEKNQPYLDNLPRIGHVFSADLFINYSDYLQTNPDPVKSGDLFAFIGIGTGRWEAFSLQKV